MAGQAAGRIIADRYALKAPLGRGGMGVVWRAQDAVLGREVAIKEVVFPPTMPDKERHPAQARVLREARAAARLDHPGAVTLYDVVQDRGGTFIVMELVEAPTLAELVTEHGPLPPVRVAELGVQLARVLEAAHAAGIVHRDVKPANVLVPERGMAKLADFGVASLQGDPQLTATGLVIGSPAYMAPEQARGEETGPPADWWALGATLFYAVEGEPPFGRGTSIATLAAVVIEPPRSPCRAGPLTDLLIALLAKDPAARPSGPKVRAWLTWVLVVAPSPSAEVQTSRGPTHRSAPALPLSVSEHAGTPASAPRTAGVGPSQRPGKGLEFDPDQAPAPRAGPTPGHWPSRPILPPAPPVPRRAGRRLLTMVSLLLVGGVLTVWLTGALQADPTGNRAAPAVTTAGLGDKSVEERGASTTARGGAGETVTTRSAPSTTTRSTTRAPTTSTRVVLRGRLPAGWRAFTNGAGSNRVGVPPGFQARTRSTYNATVVEEQGGARRVFTVRSQYPSALLPQASRDYRAWARRNFAGFREVRYAENQTYAGRGGAVVFEYVATRDGRRVHVRHINVKGRTWGYNVELIVPVGHWDASQSLARKFEQAFQPLG
jgi:eukaryotic-like serine/threonine-protein kinase